MSVMPSVSMSARWPLQAPGARDMVRPVGVTPPRIQGEFNTNNILGSILANPEFGRVQVPEFSPLQNEYGRPGVYVRTKYESRKALDVMRDSTRSLLENTAQISHKLGGAKAFALTPTLGTELDGAEWVASNFELGTDPQGTDANVEFYNQNTGQLIRLFTRNGMVGRYGVTAGWVKNGVQLLQTTQTAFNLDPEHSVTTGYQISFDNLETAYRYLGLNGRSTVEMALQLASKIYVCGQYRKDSTRDDLQGFYLVEADQWQHKLVGPNDDLRLERSLAGHFAASENVRIVSGAQVVSDFDQKLRNVSRGSWESSRPHVVDIRVAKSVTDKESLTLLLQPLTLNHGAQLIEPTIQELAATGDPNKYGRGTFPLTDSLRLGLWERVYQFLMA